MPPSRPDEAKSQGTKPWSNRARKWTRIRRQGAEHTAHPGGHGAMFRRTSSSSQRLAWAGLGLECCALLLLHLLVVVTAAPIGNSRSGHVGAAASLWRDRRDDIRSCTRRSVFSATDDGSNPKMGCHQQGRVSPQSPSTPLSLSPSLARKWCYLTNLRRLRAALETRSEVGWWGVREYWGTTSSGPGADAEISASRYCCWLRACSRFLQLANPGNAFFLFPPWHSGPGESREAEREALIGEGCLRKFVRASHE